MSNRIVLLTQIRYALEKSISLGSTAFDMAVLYLHLAVTLLFRVSIK